MTESESESDDRTAVATSGQASVACPGCLVLPDSPGAVLLARSEAYERQSTGPVQGPPAVKPGTAAPNPDRHNSAGCLADPRVAAAARDLGTATLKDLGAKPTAASATAAACAQATSSYQRFLTNSTPTPLSVRQKGKLAVRVLIDPGNLATILGTSAFTVGFDAHGPYGPGMRGFGVNAGYSFVEDATGDFFGTFLVPALMHEDPYYRRMAHASIQRRALHAISRTVVAQHDDGTPMLNYASLLTYPISAEISNLYVPGINTNGPSTVARVLTGYATDPIDNLITEFLPDLARRVHVRVIFLQSIINKVAAGQPGTE